MKKNIEISPNIETLFGTRDENLRLLEDGLNVAIAMRPDSIEIEGAASDVTRAQQVFADYQQLLRNGFTFVNGDLGAMIRVLTSDPTATLRGLANLQHSRLQNKWNLQSIHRPVISEVYFHRMVYAIQSPGLPFHFRFQKRLRVNPYVDRLAVSQGQLDLVGIAVLNLFHAVKLDRGALARVIHQGTIDIRLRRRCLHFIRRIRLNPARIAYPA